jgi:hypothetical protein
MNKGKKELKENEQNLREMSDTIKCINIRVMRVSGENKKGEEKILKEIMAETSQTK